MIQPAHLGVVSAEGEAHVEAAPQRLLVIPQEAPQGPQGDPQHDRIHTQP
jgi:hypothetical protein